MTDLNYRRTAMTFVGYDQNGIRRVFAEHSDADIAESMCWKEVLKYVRGRPDTSPVSRWTVRRQRQGQR